MSTVIVDGYVCPKCGSHNVTFEGKTITYECMDCEYDCCVKETMEITNLGQQHKDNPPHCLVCGKPMTEVKDTIAKKYTGFNWHCSCMPKNITMSLL